jgi:hypothetical protein
LIEDRSTARGNRSRRLGWTMIAAVVFAIPQLMRSKRPAIAPRPFGATDSREEELALLILRAREHGRGRDAQFPLHIP